MDEIKSINELLRSENPFPDNLMDLLLSEEESIYHDFKQTLDFGNELEWLKLTKDILAFSNTFGGYLLFGIENKTKNKIGLEIQVHDYLSDANNILLKVNKYIIPSISEIRIKSIKNGELLFIVLYIPKNATCTHIIEKSVNYTYEKGKEITPLKQGEIYVRRSGQTVIATHTDFEKLIERRTQALKDHLYENISKVIKETEPGQKIYIVSDKAQNNDGLSYRLSDSPDAVPIKGLSPTVPPRNIEEALSASIALHGFYNSFIPQASVLYDFYANRMTARFQLYQYITLTKFCMIQGIPTFYWLINCDREPVIQILNDIFPKTKFIRRELLLKMSYFIDKSLYHDFKSRIKPKLLGQEFEEANKYKGENLMIPHAHLKDDPRFRKVSTIFNNNESGLSKIATGMAISLRDGVQKDNQKLWELDYKLYANKIFTKQS
jgi:hypothetical protein